MVTTLLAAIGVFLLVLIIQKIRRSRGSIRRTYDMKPVRYLAKPLTAHIEEQPLQRELREETREHLKEWRENNRF